MSIGTLADATKRWSTLAESYVADRSNPGLAALRRAGLESFSASGFPDTRQEEWHYANLTKLVSEDFAVGETRLDAVGGERSGVSWQSLGAGADPRLGKLCDLKRHPLAALNTALLSGIAGRVAADTELEDILVLEVGTAETDASKVAYAPRLLFEVGRNARAALLLRENVCEGHWSNTVVEVFLEENASLDLIVRQSGAGTASMLISVQQERDSRLRSFVCTTSTALTRHDLEVGLVGEGSSCTLRGLFGANGSGTSNHHTWVDHRVPRCQSDEIYKGIVAGSARTAFRGRIVVRPDAQKTQALQSNPNLVLEHGAEVDTKPQLEIYADDVRCTHGSTVGQLDPEAMFFLRARGLDESAAKTLLLRGFAASVLDELPIDELRGELVEEMLALFGASA